jgi:hypothetical protein
VIVPIDNDGRPVSTPVARGAAGVSYHGRLVAAAGARTGAAVGTGGGSVPPGEALGA